MRDELYKLLRESPQAMKCGDLAGKFQTTNSCMNNTLKQMMGQAERYPDLRRREFTHGFLYTANPAIPCERVKPKKARTIEPHPLMATLWDGWGSADRLGTADKPLWERLNES